MFSGVLNIKGAAYEKYKDRIGSAKENVARRFNDDKLQDV